MVKIFTLFELQKFPKYFRSKTVAKLITTGLFLLVFGFIAVGIYSFFRSGLRYISLDIIEDLQQPLLLFLYELFLLILSAVIVLSSFVAGLFSLFKKDSMSWIMSTPEYKEYPRFVYVKSLLSSSWPLLILFVPAILAFTKVFTLPWYGIALMVLAVLLTLATLNATTLTFILLMAHIYNLCTKVLRRLSFTITNLIIFIIGISAVSLVILWKKIAYLDIVKLFRAEETDVVISLASIGNHFDFFLTHPFAMFLVNFQFGNYAGAFSYLGLLVALTIVTVGLWWYISPTFYPLWKRFQDGNTTLDTTKEVHHRRLSYHFLGNKSMALFKKELLVALRDLRGVMWFFFLFGIWVSQIIASVMLNKNVIFYQTDLSQKMIMIQVLQYMIALYFISSFALRFVFTSFSTEKRTRWILGSAPLSFKKIFLGKYFFFISSFIVLSLVMGYASVVALNLTLTRALYLLILFLTTVIGIVTLALTLGARYPSFETDDPEVISTSIPGLLFTAIALLYSALSAYVLYLTITKGTILFFGLQLLATALFTGALLYTTMRLKQVYYAE